MSETEVRDKASFHSHHFSVLSTRFSIQPTAANAEATESKRWQ